MANGFFFDWGFASGVLNFDFVANKAGLYDTGDRRVMLTTLGTISSTVLGILRNPGPTENRLIRVHDFFLTNKEIVEVVQGVTGKTFETYSISTKEMGEKGKAMMPSEQGAGLQLVALFWGEKAAAVWEEEDESAVVGLEKKNVNEVVSQVLKGMNVLS